MVVQRTCCWWGQGGKATQRIQPGVCHLVSGTYLWGGQNGRELASASACFCCITQWVCRVIPAGCLRDVEDGLGGREFWGIIIQGGECQVRESESCSALFLQGLIPLGYWEVCLAAPHPPHFYFPLPWNLDTEQATASPLTGRDLAALSSQLPNSTPNRFSDA